jgi:hypothetical protein
LRHLFLRESTQRWGWFEAIFQPSLARRELFIASIDRIPSPPNDLGLQMLFQDKRERQCLFSCG